MYYHINDISFTNVWVYLCSFSILFDDLDLGINLLHIVIDYYITKLGEFVEMIVVLHHNPCTF